MDESKENKSPEWLDSNFLCKAIRSFKKDDSIEVVKFKVESAIGEHFASTMLRSNIEFKSRKYQDKDHEMLNVVIKIDPAGDGNLENVVAGGPLFETETDVYHNVIPRMHEVYERNGIDVKFAPKLIYAENEPRKVVIVEDLTPKEFVVFRSPPKNPEESKLLVKRLAQFHAASLYLDENNEVDFTRFNYTIYQTEFIIDFFFRDTIKAFKEVVETWEGYESYLPKLDYVIENIGKIGIQSYSANKKGCGLNVLNHGDLHLRNILIKANREQHIEDFYFVDYQLSVWCSPVVDLTFMMGLFRLQDAEEDFKEKLIMFYHKELCDALKSIGYMKAPPTLLDLNVELVKHGALNIAIWINFFPFLFVDWENMKVEDMMGVDSERSRNFKKSLYDSPVLKALIQKDMKQWTYKGWW